MVIAISLSVSLLIPALPTVAAIRTVPSSSQQRDGATYTVLPQSLAVLRRGAKRSLGFRNWHGRRRYIMFPTQIQHIVVIDMENRTPDNLFAAYYGRPWQGQQNVQWQNVMNIANPNVAPTLVPYPLTTATALSMDPNHEHDSGFLQETQNGFGSANLGCHVVPCPKGLTVYSYVPYPGVDPYAQLMQNYASADEVFQANEGPSMPSHQYLIAGQSGGLKGSATSPLGIASNPGGGDEDVTGNYTETGEEYADGQPGTAPYCAGGAQSNAGALDLYVGTQPQYAKNNPPINPPCETYTNGTILDEIAAGPLATPAYDDWQFISATVGGFWAAPTAVKNLYQDYVQGNPATQPFAVDPNAYNFLRSLTGSGQPQRPFAALTYLTPCFDASDHANSNGGNDYGPQWVGTIVNAIGKSSYWQNTAIIIMWDDWGGWYDHVPFVESSPNPYGDQTDPNEWGFRVPFIVVSPWVTNAGYVSHGPNGTLTNPVPRSQSAVLKFIEDTFGLGSLGTDDAANDDLMDMFQFNKPLPFTPVSFSAHTFTNQCGS